MSNPEIIIKPNIELWNLFLSNFHAGNFEQSYEYGEISKKSFSRTEVYRLAMKNDAKSDYYDLILQGTFSRYLGFGMTLEVMKGPLVRRGIENSFPFIGRKFGGKDHTTAIHAYEKISKILEKDESLNEEIDLIKQRVLSG